MCHLQAATVHARVCDATLGARRSEWEAANQNLVGGGRRKKKAEGRRECQDAKSGPTPLFPWLGRKEFQGNTLFYRMHYIQHEKKWSFFKIYTQFGVKTFFFFYVNKKYGTLYSRFYWFFVLTGSCQEKSFYSLKGPGTAGAPTRSQEVLLGILWFDSYVSGYACLGSVTTKREILRYCQLELGQTFHRSDSVLNSVLGCCCCRHQRHQHWTLHCTQYHSEVFENINIGKALRFAGERQSALLELSQRCENCPVREPRWRDSSLTRSAVNFTWLLPWQWFANDADNL